MEPNAQRVSRPTPNFRPTLIVLIVGGVILLALSGSAAHFGTPVSLPKNAAGIGAAAGILALAGAIAVAVERLLEIAWTVVDQVASNPVFPFKSWASSLEEFASQIGTLTKPALDQAATDTKNLMATADAVPADLEPLNKEIADLQTAVQAIVATGDPTVGDGLKALQQGLKDLVPKLSSPTTQAAVGATVSGISALNQFLTSLTTDPNPGRRLMSMFIGSYLGLAAAWIFGLDVIQAALGTGDQSTLHWGLALTGVVIGLGSVPLHELIAGLQAFKAAQGGLSTTASRGGG